MKLKICEVVSSLEHLNEEQLKKSLENNMIKEYAYILHDKDTQEDGTLKYKHYHVALRLKDSYDTKHIAKWFGIGENFVKKVEGKFEDLLLYLTHENAKEKYQYSINEVKSNFDYESKIKEIQEKKKAKEINVDARTLARMKKQKRKKEIIDMIDKEVIREFNKNEYISAEENVEYAFAIDRTFKYVQERAENQVDRKMECIFITGESGAGKTTYARQLAEKKGYSIFVSSGSNDVMDGYKGQDCIILDDLRPSCMGLSDLLKFLDNDLASTVKSRFKNKCIYFCKLIIITTTLDLDTFFSNVFKEEEESKIQLQRRCTRKITMTVDKIFVSYWERKSRQYSTPIVAKNPVKELYSPVDITKEEIQEDLKEFLGLEEVSTNEEEEKQNNEELEIINFVSMQVDAIYQKKEFYELLKSQGFENYGNDLQFNTNGRQNIAFEIFGNERSYIITFNVEVTEKEIKILSYKIK